VAVSKESLGPAEEGEEKKTKRNKSEGGLVIKHIVPATEEGEGGGWGGGTQGQKWDASGGQGEWAGKGRWVLNENLTPIDRPKDN